MPTTEYNGRLLFVGRRRAMEPGEVVWRRGVGRGWGRCGGMRLFLLTYNYLHVSVAVSRTPSGLRMTDVTRTVCILHWKRERVSEVCVFLFIAISVHVRVSELAMAPIAGWSQERVSFHMLGCSVFTVAMAAVILACKFQALVYDILPSTTAVFSYATGSRKLSANEQFFVGAQTVVGLLQTTQIKQGVSFIAASKVYTSTNKSTIVWIETELFFFIRGGCASHIYVRAWALGCFHSRISTQTFRRALTASVDSCAAEIKSAPSVT